MTEEERIFRGMLFASEEPELIEKKLKAHRLSQEYSLSFEEEKEKRDRILHELLAEIGEGTFMLGPIRFHYGCHTKIGAHCFMNFNFTVQDDALVTIGNNNNFGPNVTIVTPMHPMIAEERRGMICSDGVERFLCYAKPVTIGNDCWFGANVVARRNNWRQRRYRGGKRSDKRHSPQFLCGWRSGKGDQDDYRAGFGQEDI